MQSVQKVKMFCLLQTNFYYYYVRHSEVMIKRLESAGLGFSTKSSQASHMLGMITSFKMFIFLYIHRTNSFKAVGL